MAAVAAYRLRPATSRSGPRSWARCSRTAALAMYAGTVTRPRGRVSELYGRAPETIIPATRAQDDVSAAHGCRRPHPFGPYVFRRYHRASPVDCNDGDLIPMRAA